MTIVFPVVAEKLAVLAEVELPALEPTAPFTYAIATGLLPISLLAQSPTGAPGHVCDICAQSLGGQITGGFPH